MVEQEFAPETDSVFEIEKPKASRFERAKEAAKRSFRAVKEQARREAETVKGVGREVKAGALKAGEVVQELEQFQERRTQRGISRAKAQAQLESARARVISARLRQVKARQKLVKREPRAERTTLFGEKTGSILGGNSAGANVLTGTADSRDNPLISEGKRGKNPLLGR